MRRTALVVVMAWALSACQVMPLEYEGTPIEFRVVDAKTKEPIEGVIAGAQWILEKAKGLNISPDINLLAMETVSDTNGIIRFPAWGPIEQPDRDHRLTTRDPLVILFRQGYEPEELFYRAFDGPFDMERYAGRERVRHFSYNGKTIELNRADRKSNEYRTTLEIFGFDLEPALRDCSWRKMPRFIKALVEEDDYIASIDKKQPDIGIHRSLRLLKKCPYLN